MSQNFIVLIIVALTVGWVIFKMIKSIITPKKTSGCGGCTGCDLSSKNKGCCNKPSGINIDRHLIEKSR